jgi:hypothetical protein
MKIKKDSPNKKPAFAGLLISHKKRRESKLKLANFNVENLFDSIGIKVKIYSKVISFS